MSVAFPPCPKCDGSGEVAMEDIPVSYMTCPSCEGRGVLITDELVEEAACAAFEAEFGPPVQTWGAAKEAYTDEDGFDAEAFQADNAYYYKAGRAVLVAVVEKLKENQ